MKKINKYTIILILIINILLAAGDFQSLTIFQDQFYLLNGFDNKLVTYDVKGNKIIEDDLSNIDRNVTSDYFIKYSDKNSYLFSSVSNNIYLLDENYNLQKQINSQVFLGVNLFKKIFPISYNSLLLSNDERDKLYVLKNMEIVQLIKFSEEPVDFYYTNERIYILFDNRVDAYTDSGIYLRALPFKNIEKVLNIFVADNMIFISHKNGVESLVLKMEKTINNIQYQRRVLDESGVQDIAINGKMIGYLKDNKILFKEIK